jgi:hypothetical protein
VVTGNDGPTPRPVPQRFQQVLLHTDADASVGAVAVEAVQ